MNVTTPNGTNVDLVYAEHLFAGHGHRTVKVEIFYEGHYKKFSHTTTRTDLVEDADEIDNPDSRYAALFDIIAGSIEDEMAAWMKAMDEIPLA